MRAKLDENLPIEAAELLRAAGWSCDTVRDEGLGGAEDPKVGAAVKAIGDARGLEVPETKEQRQWLEEFAAWLASTKAPQLRHAADGAA